MEMVLTPGAERFLAEWRDEKDFVIAHTSGSTGVPKEVHLLKSDMAASARATTDFLGLISGSSPLLLPLSADYIAGKMQIVRALVAGCQLVCEAPSSHPFVDFELEASLLPVVPAQLDSVVRTGLYRRVRDIIVGGAPIDVSTERRLCELKVNAWATYGMTETCSHVALRHVGSEFYEGLPGFRFSTDDRGCLVIVSSTLSFGTLVTNDLVEIKSSCSFKWLGRADNVINSGGVKIHPEAEERKIAEALGGRRVEFYVTSRPSLRWGREAVVVTTAPEEVFPEKIIRTSGSLIKAVIRVEKMDYTPSGKLLRRAID